MTDLSFKRTLYIINGIERYDLFILVLLGLLAVSAMSFYDFVLKRTLRLNIPNWKVFRVSFVANSFNNVLGFGGLAGVGLRTMLYKEHTNDVKRLVAGIAWLTSSALLGLSVFSILTIARILPVGEITGEKPWLWAVIAGVALIVPAALIAAWINNKKLAQKTVKQNRGIRFSYIGASFAEWFAASSCIIPCMSWGFTRMSAMYSVYLPLLLSGNHQPCAGRIRFV